ncbi:hypothetical protein ACAE110713_10910 [Achromobacter aegrifaciens]
MRRMVRRGERCVRSGASSPASSPHSRTSASSRSSRLPARPPTKVSHIPGSVDLLSARRATHRRPSGVHAFRCTALVSRPSGRTAARSITPSGSSPSRTSSNSSRQPRRQLAWRNSCAACSSTPFRFAPGCRSAPMRRLAPSVAMPGASRNASHAACVAQPQRRPAIYKARAPSGAGSCARARRSAYKSDNCLGIVKPW